MISNMDKIPPSLKNCWPIWYWRMLCDLWLLTCTWNSPSYTIDRYISKKLGSISYPSTYILNWWPNLLSFGNSEFFRKTLLLFPQTLLHSIISEFKIKSWEYWSNPNNMFLFRLRIPVGVFIIAKCVRAI